MQGDAGECDCTMQKAIWRLMSLWSWELALKSRQPFFMSPTCSTRHRSDVNMSRQQHDMGHGRWHTS